MFQVVPVMIQNVSLTIGICHIFGTENYFSCVIFPIFGHVPIVDGMWLLSGRHNLHTDTG